jgi:hypothetical protein
MGLFGGGNHSIYKDTPKERARASTPNPRAKSCGSCHGKGEKLNGAGRGTGKPCKACHGSGMR